MACIPRGMNYTLECPNCGAPNINKTAWCEKCLTPFDPPKAEDKELDCPVCQHINDYTLDHCEVCHEPLKPGQSE